MNDGNTFHKLVFFLSQFMKNKCYNKYFDDSFLQIEIFKLNEQQKRQNHNLHKINIIVAYGLSGCDRRCFNSFVDISSARVTLLVRRLGFDSSVSVVIVYLLSLFLLILYLIYPNKKTKTNDDVRQKKKNLI